MNLYSLNPPDSSKSCFRSLFVDEDSNAETVPIRRATEPGIARQPPQSWVLMPVGLASAWTGSRSDASWSSVGSSARE